MTKGRLLWWKFRLTLAILLFPKQGVRIEGRSSEMSFCFEGWIFSLCANRADPAERQYSRETVYQMLAIVREQERRMNWKCPEPDQPKYVH